MIQPQDIYDYRDIIIPVIGNNCFVYNSASEEVSLQEFVVDTLTKEKNLSHDMLSQMKTRGYYGLTLLKKHCFPNKESKFKLEYKRAIDSNKDKIHLNETIKRFLQVYQFPVVCAKHRMHLSKNNPKIYLQPLGMILLRMSGLAYRMNNEYEAELCRKKALFVFKRTDLNPVQYEIAIQQLADNISKLRNSYKSLFGMLFKVNDKKMNDEFKEFVEFFN